MTGWAFSAAFRLAVSLSGKNDDEIAAAMGWSESVKNRIFHNHDYWPSLPTVPRLCAVLGNTIVARWIIDNANFLIRKVPPTDAPTLLRQLREAMKEFSDIMEHGQAALEDWHISRQEARRIIREMSDLMRVMGEMFAGLQAVILQDKEASPL